MNSKTLSTTLTAVLISTACLSRLFADETIYFLVAVPRVNDGVVQRDSYVVPLSKQEDIEHARYLISLGRSVFSEPHSALVGARVGPGRDGINRNYFDPKFPEWSWHVVEFQEFADYSSEEQDGSPTQLEKDPAWYLGIAGRGGLIGFWVYTIVRELGPVPLYLSILPEGQNLNFYWTGVGTNHVYTIEAKESLAGANWMPLTGALWPLNTNQWTVPLTNETSQFYRVRAEQAP